MVPVSYSRIYALRIPFYSTIHNLLASRSGAPLETIHRIFSSVPTYDVCAYFGA